MLREACVDKRWKEVKETIQLVFVGGSDGVFIVVVGGGGGGFFFP